MNTSSEGIKYCLQPECIIGGSCGQLTKTCHVQCIWRKKVVEHTVMLYAKIYTQIYTRILKNDRGKWSIHDWRKSRALNFFLLIREFFKFQVAPSF